MRRESPIKSLFTHMVAQTYGDLGRDKGEVRLCFGNCGNKEPMSQGLLSPEKDTAHRGGFGAKPVHLSGGGVGKADWQVGIWRERSGRRESVNEQKVEKHIGGIVLKVGLQAERAVKTGTELLCCADSIGRFVVCVGNPQT